MTARNQRSPSMSDNDYHKQIEVISHRYGETKAVGFQTARRCAFMQKRRPHCYIVPKLTPPSFPSASPQKQSVPVITNLPLTTVKQNFELFETTYKRPCSSNEMLQYIRGTIGVQHFPQESTVEDNRSSNTNTRSTATESTQHIVTDSPLSPHKHCDGDSIPPAVTSKSNDKEEV